MEVEIFTLCDYAQDTNGKTTIVGTFDTINAPTYPFVIPTCSIALRIRFTRAEAGRHQFKVSFVNEDGQNLLPEFGGEGVIVIAPGNDHATLNACLGIGQLAIPRAGKYSIDLVVDGRQERSLPLTASSQPMQRRAAA
jgi:hypothetical protein